MNIVKRIKIGWFALVALSLPHIASAATCGTVSASTFQNPLSICSLADFVQSVLKVFMMIALPVIAFFIVMAGFNFVIARGNPQKLSVAKWNFLFVIIGTCLMLGAWLLSSLIGATIMQIAG